MWWNSLTGLLALAVLPVISAVPTDGDVHSSQLDRRVLKYEYGRAGGATHNCTLHALGGTQDDSDNLVSAVNQCGKNGVITLPDPIYNLNKVLNLTLSNCTIDFYGFIKYSDDIYYWTNNSWHIPALQNQALALSFMGDNFVLDGHNVGGINGNGQVWYSYAKGVGNVFGRPMTLSLVNANNVMVKDFSVIQPQFWSHLTVQSNNITYLNCYVNATNNDPNVRTYLRITSSTRNDLSQAVNDTKSWLENTDGADTWRSNNVTFQNFVYQGGDDCIALKPNSTQITINNLTCHGSTGLAFGSIGQYPNATDIIEDVLFENVAFYPSSQSQTFRGIEFKSWVG
ncbi:MAG: hypothetical protein TREMPRED_000571, partial [Tremellales sp. Tagirdzhanova-0007]